MYAVSPHNFFPKHALAAFLALYLKVLIRLLVQGNPQFLSADPTFRTPGWLGNPTVIAEGDQGLGN